MVATGLGAPSARASLSVVRGQLTSNHQELIKNEDLSFPPAPRFTPRALGLHCDCSELPASAKLALPSSSPSQHHLDLISHDEMFPAIHKIWEIQDQLWLGLEGKMVRRTEGNIDDAVIDGNASVGGPDGEGTFESTVITGVDIVINHHFTTEAYKKYIKDYMKSIKGKLEEQRPEKVKPFVAGAAEQTKHIRANFKTYQFFRHRVLGTSSLLLKTCIQMVWLLCWATVRVM